MALSRRQIEQLIKAVSLTRAEEVTCEQCLWDLAQFAEHSLPGKTIPEGLQAIEHHLAICPDCREEYEALLIALQDQGQ